MLILINIIYVNRTCKIIFFTNCYFEINLAGSAIL